MSIRSVNITWLFLLSLVLHAQAQTDFNINTQTASTYELAGPWKFHWQRTAADKLDAPDTIIFNPTSWNNYRINGESLGANGFAVYTLEILSDSATDVGISLKGFYSSYNLYLNDFLLASNGRFGSSAETSALAWQPQVVPVRLDSGLNVLLLEVSNFQHSKGGFFHPIRMGDFDVLQAEREQDLIVDAFTAGAFILIGVFFLGMFFAWRKDWNYLIYFFLTASYGVRLLSNGTHILKAWLSDWSWQVLVGIEYFSFYTVWWSSLSLIAFAWPVRLYKIYSGLFLAMMVAVVLLPLRYYSQILLPSVVVGFSCYLISLFFLWRKKDAVSNRTFYAVLIFLLLALAGWILEFLLYARLLEISVGFPNIFRLLAVLSLAFLVSERYNTDYEQVEGLKLEAEQQSDTIRQQYITLEEQQATLQVRNQEIETLLKEVHHRVKNNLQLITSLLDTEDRDSSPESIASILEDSQTRVATMSLIHQNLYMHDNLATIPLEEYLRDLIRHIANIHKVQNMELDLRLASFDFDVDTMVPLGLAVNELITNSFKYRNREKIYSLSIVCEQTAAGEYRMVVGDQGADLPRPLAELVRSGYGLRLAHRLSIQLMGSLQHHYNQGNHFKLIFWDTDRRKQIL